MEDERPAVEGSLFEPVSRLCVGLLIRTFSSLLFWLKEEKEKQKERNESGSGAESDKEQCRSFWRRRVDEKRKNKKKKEKEEEKVVDNNCSIGPIWHIWPRLCPMSKTHSRHTAHLLCHLNLAKFCPLFAHNGKQVGQIDWPTCFFLFSLSPSEHSHSPKQSFASMWAPRGCCSLALESVYILVYILATQ